MRKLRGISIRPPAVRAWMAMLCSMVLAMLIMPDHASAAASAEDMEAAVEKVLKAGDYQTELPLPRTSGDGGGEHTDPLSEPDWWRKNQGDVQAPDMNRPAMEPRESKPFDLDLPPELMKVLRFLMWTVIFVGGALLVYYLANEAWLFSRWKKQGRTEGRSGHDDGGAGDAGPWLGDYEGLAARGDYAGAIHALLLHCIAALSERGAALSASMTSREILRRLALERDEQEALAVLVRMTEVTHFGGRTASEEDFLKCRDLYHALAAEGAA